MTDAKPSDAAMERARMALDHPSFRSVMPYPQRIIAHALDEFAAARAKEEREIITSYEHKLTCLMLATGRPRRKRDDGSWEDHVDAVAAAIDKMATDLTAARELLKEMEWGDKPMYEPEYGSDCFFCGRDKDAGHQDDCRLLTALRAATASTEHRH